MYKVKLGVDFLGKKDLRNIESRINKITDTTHRAKIDLDTSRIHKQFDHIEKRFKSLTGTKGSIKGAVPIDTGGLEQSLNKVASIVGDIKTSIGSLDGGNMKSLLSSINQIATSLGRASEESETLVSALNALSKKDFNINLGIDMGKKSLNTIGYGRAARKQVIPELESQIAELEGLLGGQQATMKKLSSQSKNLGFDIFTDFGDFNSDSAIKKMEAMEKYVNTLKKLAVMDNVNLDGFNEVHKDASELINDITGLDNAVDKAGDVPQNLKNIFGGSVDGENLGKQLDSIVVDLGEIKTALQGLSSGVSVDGMTQSFNRLSEILEKLTTNAKLAQDVLGGVGSGANTGVGDKLEKQAQQAQQSTKEIQQAAKQTSDAYNQMSKGASTLSNLDSLNLKDDIDEADKLAAALSRLKNVQSNIKKIDIGNLDTSKGIQELQTLEKQLESLSAEYNETVAEINSKGGVSAAQFQSVQNEIKNTELQLERLKAELREDIKLKIKTDIAKNIQKAHADVDKLSGDIVELKQNLDLLDNIEVDLNTAAANNDLEGLKTGYQDYLRVLKEVKAQIDIDKLAEQKDSRDANLELDKQRALSKLKGLFGENSQAARKFASEIDRIEKEIEQCGSADGLRILNKQINNLEASAKSANYKTHTFGQNLSKQWERYKSYLSVASVFMYAEQGLRDMFQQVVAIDTAMTELKKVTDETSATYDKFLTNAGQRASEIGTTIDGLVTSTADFARLGYDFADAANLAEVANIYTVVGDEIDSVDTATQSVISTMKAFKVEAADSMSIVDKFNEVSNNFAISSGGIGEALTRSASSLAAANNSLDESIALITASNSVVQDPTVVGRLMPTLKMAISVKG